MAMAMAMSMTMTATKVMMTATPPPPRPPLGLPSTSASTSASTSTLTVQQQEQEQKQKQKQKQKQNQQPQPQPEEESKWNSGTTAAVTVSSSPLLLLPQQQHHHHHHQKKKNPRLRMTKTMTTTMTMLSLVKMLPILLLLVLLLVLASVLSSSSSLTTDTSVVPTAAAAFMPTTTKLLLLFPKVDAFSTIRQYHRTTTTTSTTIPSFGRAASGTASPTTTYITSKNSSRSTSTSIFTTTTSSSLSSTTTTTPSSTYKGEADLALERGLALDKMGLPRLANSCFLEAATLLQCYLELPNNFAYVTNLVLVNDSDDDDNENDNENDNGESTSTSTSTITAVLAYTLIRLAFNNLDALSDPKAACRLYEMASLIDKDRPSATSFAGLGTAIEASASSSSNNNNNSNNDLDFLHHAIQAYRRALDIVSYSPTTKSQSYGTLLPLTELSLAVALERLGHHNSNSNTNTNNTNDNDSDSNPYLEESTRILERMSRQESIVSCYVDSWGYVRWHTRKTSRASPQQLNLHRGTRDMLKIALDAAMPLIVVGNDNDNGNDNDDKGGLVCEFGVGNGRSLRMTQELLPLSVKIHGFDTFTGLPQAWHNEPAGTYSTGGVVPQMEHTNVYFHKGLFSETLQPFLHEQGDDAFVAYANIDCDLYTSTLDILEAFHGRLRVGSILVFDEYICHPTWRQDEFRAWRECCKRFGWTYEYLAFSLGTKQAVVKITSVA